MHLAETAWVEFEIDGDVVCDFIKDCADEEDKRQISRAMGGERSLGKDTLLDSLKMDMALKIMDNCSLQDLYTIENKLMKGDL